MIYIYRITEIVLIPKRNKLNNSKLHYLYYFELPKKLDLTIILSYIIILNQK